MSDRPIDTVLFDAYGTLFEDAMNPLREICARIVEENAIPLRPSQFLRAWDRIFFPILRNDDFVTLREANGRGLQLLFEELGIERPPTSYVNEIFGRFSRSPLYPDVMDTLSQLHDVSIAIVSNADTDHLQEALQLAGLDFGVVVSSEGARCYKPDAAIFHQALELLGRSAENALYVGDSQEDDIVGAKRAGLRVAWLNRRGERRRDGIPEPDYEISSLEELVGILRS